MVKNTTPANAGDIGNVGSIPGSGKSPGGGHGNPLQYSCLENPRQPTPVFLPGESHGQRSVLGYVPLGRKESDMIEAT